MLQTRVFTIVLNTNRLKDTLDCLASLEKSDYVNNTIIVLDNKSTNGSVEVIRKTYPSIQIIELVNNAGYAGNNNVGIRAAIVQGAEWVFVLNEDTILAPDCITHMVSIGESSPDIGIVGPMVYHYDEPSVIQSAGGNMDPWWFPSHIGKNEVDQGQFPAPRPVDWISGCAIMVRGTTIAQIGQLDERFFYYWEETEWCLRARVNGWRIIHVPQAKLWHKGVQRDYRPAPYVTYYSTRNRFLMLSKHRAPLYIRFYVGWQTLLTLASWTIRPKWRTMIQHRNAMWHGLVDFSRQRWGPMPS